MLVVLIDIFFGLVSALLGLLGGWWLWYRHIEKTPGQSVKQTNQTREALARLRDMASRMSAQIGQHSSQVEELNDELSAVDVQNPDAVMQVVSKLVMLNGQMQQHLASAGERLREQAQEIESHAVAARTDPLTLLANRRAFDDEMKRRMSEFSKLGRNFSLVMVDIDDFKSFNDSYGHQAGDEVLRRVAETLRDSVCDGDLVTRYGGEEFALILPGAAVGQACLDGERVRNAVDNLYVTYHKTEMHVTTSLGVAQALVEEDLTQLIERADSAMYTSKEDGRNCTHWHDGNGIHRVQASQEPEISEMADEPVEPESSDAESSKPESSDAESSDAESSKPESSKPESSDAEFTPWSELAGNLPQVSEFRRLLNSRIAEWKRGGSAPSVLLVDIDHFEEMRETHGNQAAELVFRTTTKFLKAAIREMDMVSHYGGTTFAMLLPGAGVYNAIGVAERLRHAIARCSLPTTGKPLQFAVSVGGAEATSTDSPQSLRDRCEEALEASRQSGGDCTFFHNGQWSETSIATLERLRQSPVNPAV